MPIHVVMPGETLELLAATYSVSQEHIIIENGLIYPYPLAVGQALIIARPAKEHTVRAGETVYSIAVDNGIPLEELYQNNPELSDGDPPAPGQILILDFWGEKQEKSISVLGYVYPGIDRTLLERALPFLTYLSIFSYRFHADGSLAPADDEALILAARRHQVHPILVLASLDESGNFSSVLLHTLLNSEALQDALLSELIPTMSEKGYRGLDVDFEYIPAEDADAFVRFLEKTRDLLHSNGMTLNVDLAPKTRADQPGLLYEGLNYPRIGEIADICFLMTYEWATPDGPPMAIAPIDQVAQVVNYATSVIPREKLLLGIPNYGYDWALPYVPGQSEASSIGNSAAAYLAATTNSVILYDEAVQAPHFSYQESGTEHEVWFEDVRSLQAQYALQEEAGLLGVGYWNLMRPFPQNWTFLSTRYNITKLL